MADLLKLEAPKDWEFTVNDEIGSNGHLEWLREVVLHVESVLGPWLDLHDAVALYKLLDLYCLQFADGFVVNIPVGLGLTDMEVGSYIGGNQTMLVASAFVEDPGVTYFVLRGHRSADV